MKYKVKVKVFNKIFIIKDKPVRSPFESIVNENQLKLLKSKIKFYGLRDSEYEIENIDETIISNNKDDYSYIRGRTPDIKKRENLNFNTSNNNNNITENSIEPIQKIFNKDINDKDHNELIELCRDLKDNTEQNKKENDDTEVKIEELSLKSSSILEKFLLTED